MNGYEYEKYVAKYLRSCGYSNVKVTKKSNDFGVDLLARKHRQKYAVQCKYYSNPVGVAAVQEVAAGMNYYRCQRGMVVTNSTYTNAARKLAASNGIKLIEGIVPRKTGLKRLFWWFIYYFIGTMTLIAMFEVVQARADSETISCFILVCLLYFVPAGRWLLPKIMNCIIFLRNHSKKPRRIHRMRRGKINRFSVSTKVVVPERFADKQTILQCLKPYYPEHAEEYSEVLSRMDHILISLFCRNVNPSIEWADGRQIRTILIDNGLVETKVESDYTAYIWTDKAKTGMQEDRKHKDWVRILCRSDSSKK